MTFAEKGISNFLLSNGDVLIAHCSTHLSYIVRQAPFGQAHLSDEDMSVDFRQLTTPADRVAVITSMPLTDNESWVDMRPGTLWMFHDGEVCAQRDTLPSPFRSMAEMNACLG